MGEANWGGWGGGGQGICRGMLKGRKGVGGRDIGGVGETEVRASIKIDTEGFF
jgi:hypothetical protein